jgi:general secretion pathway protein B
MSLILEALKKSEARRQLGEAPGLGTPFTVARRRRSPLPVIGVLILAAAGFGWYYLRTKPAVVASGEVAAAKPSAPDKSIAGKPNMQSMAPASPASAAANRFNTPAASPRTAPASDVAQRTPFGGQAGAAPVTRADPRTRDPRAVNPQGTPPVAGDGAMRMAQRPLPGAAAAPIGAGAQARGAPEARLASAQGAAAAPAIPGQAAPQPSALNAGAAGQAAVASVAPKPATASPPPPAATAPAAQAAAVPVAAAPDMPLYYELPFNVRKDLPTLAVSMHVYAAVPGQRFVVIDGDRRAEGDVVKEGLTLREIRSDGIVLEFRGQKFFYPRPGR